MQWRSLEGLTTAIIVLLWGAIAFGVLSIVAFANRLVVIDDILSADFDRTIGDRADDADAFVGASAIFLGLVSLAIFVLIIIWTFRAMKNNEYLGRDNARFTSGWGIAGWLIPFANLVIPVLIFQDLWRGSDASVPRGDPGWRQAKGSALVGWWWATFLISRFSLPIGQEAETRDEIRDLRTSDQAAIATLVVSFAAAILLMRVLREIATRQVEVRDKIY